MKQHHYYKIGTKDNIVISNSSMSAINPSEGGHPTKFLEFFNENKEELSTRSLNNGKVVHSYIENKDNFAIDDLDRPEDKICLWADKILELLESGDYGSNEAIEDREIIEDIHTIAYQMNYEYTEHEIQSIILTARDSITYYPKWGVATVIKKFKENRGVDYLLFKLTNKDKHILSLANKQVVEACIKSLENNKHLKNRLFEPIKKEFKLYKEVAICFKFPVQTESGNTIILKGKALLDNLHIDEVNNVVFIEDLKTTAKSIYHMSPNKEKGQIGTVHAYNYHRQLAWYRFAVECLEAGIETGNAFMMDSEKNKIPVKFTKGKSLRVYTSIVAVETTGDFRSGIIPIGSKWIEKGDKEIQDIIKRITWHIDSENWEESREESYGGFIKMEHPIQML